MSTTEVVSQIIDQMQAPVQDMVPNNNSSPEAKTPESQTLKDEKISPRLEVLIRREQQALQRERVAKQRESELEAKLKRIEEFESAKGNSKKALELLGLDYNQLTQSLIQDGDIPAEVQIKKIEEKFDSFKSQQEKEKQEREQEEQRRAQVQADRAIDGFKTEINTYLSDNKTRYELIDFEGQQSLVFDVIDEHYTRTLNQETGVGKVMSISEAADKVEEYLEKKYNDAKKVNKVQSLWSAVPKGTLANAVKAESRSSQKPQTLTNNLSASPTPPRRTPVSDEERIQKAIAYAKGLRPG